MLNNQSSKLKCSKREQKGFLRWENLHYISNYVITLIIYTYMWKLIIATILNNLTKLFQHL